MGEVAYSNEKSFNTYRVYIIQFSKSRNRQNGSWLMSDGEAFLKQSNYFIRFECRKEEYSERYSTMRKDEKHLYTPQVSLPVEIGDKIYFDYRAAYNYGDQTNIEVKNISVIKGPYIPEHLHIIAY